MIRYVKDQILLYLFCFLIINFSSSGIDAQTKLPDFSKIITPRLISHNIKLDFLKESHAEELFYLTDNNRDYLKKWLPWVNNCKSIEDSKQFIIQSIQCRENKKSLIMGIWCSDAIVGVISFHKFFLEEQRGDIGYWLSEAFQKRGIISQSCQELMKIGFLELGLKSLLITCAKENTRSQRVPIRLGFKEKLLLQSPNLNLENLYYQITFEEWKDITKYGD